MPPTDAPAKVETTVVDGKTKYTIVFALTDGDGKPLLDRNRNPRVTNLIADSMEDLVAKIAESNQRAMRNLDKAQRRNEVLESHTPTPARPAPNLEPTPLTPDQQVEVGLELQDPRKAAAAVQRVVESVVPVAEISATVKRHDQESAYERGLRAGREFAANHRDDYFPCQANSQALIGYLQAQTPPLEVTVGNLEIAFAKCFEQLTERPPSPAPPHAPPPSPDPHAPPQNAPPQPAPPPAIDRRPPSSGIRNSDASRPPVTPEQLTREQAYHMLYNNRSEYERWMRDPRLNSILTEALKRRA